MATLALRGWLLLKRRWREAWREVEHESQDDYDRRQY